MIMQNEMRWSQTERAVRMGMLQSVMIAIYSTGAHNGQISPTYFRVHRCIKDAYAPLKFKPSIIYRAMFAKILKTLRKKNDTTQCDLADQLGVKQSTVSSWEIGRSRPTYEQVVAIANIFSTTTDYLLGRSENDNNYVASDSKIMQEFCANFVQLSKQEQLFLVQAVKAYNESKK